MFSSKLKLILIAAVGIAVGTSSMMLYQKHQGPRRSIASIAPYTPQRLVLGKQAAAMSVEVVGPETYPDNSTEIVELVGYITQNFEGDSWLNYRWLLPRGVELVQGQITGDLQNLKLGQPYQVSILVRGFSTEKQKLIALSSQLEKAGNQLKASAVVVSRPEDTMDHRVAKILEHVREEKVKRRSRE